MRFPTVQAALLLMLMGGCAESESDPVAVRPAVRPTQTALATPTLHPSPTSTPSPTPTSTPSPTPTPTEVPLVTPVVEPTPMAPIEQPSTDALPEDEPQ